MEENTEIINNNHLQINNFEEHIIEYILVSGKLSPIYKINDIDLDRIPIGYKYELDFNNQKYSTFEYPNENNVNIYEILLYENQKTGIRFDLIDNQKEYDNTFDLYKDLDKIFYTHEELNDEILSNLDTQIDNILDKLNNNKLDNFVIILKYNVLMYYPDQLIESIKDYVLDKLGLSEMK